MKKAILVVVFFCVVIPFCQAQKIETKPGFELSLSENLLSGSGSLMNYVGVNIGYSFKTNDKIMLDLSWGVSATEQSHNSQVLSLMYGHEIRFSEQFGTQVAIGPGVLRDIGQQGSYSIKPVGVLDLQHRFYFSQKGFVGFSGKVYIAKDYCQASFIGFTWGTKW